MTGRLRLGVLGAGMIAVDPVGVLPNLPAIRDKVEVVAIADTAADRARAAAEKFGIPAAYGSLSEMLAGSDVDGVVNLTPIPEHGATSIQVLAAGKHLCTEKPLATTMAEADRIGALAHDRELTVVCAPFNMLYPDRARARSLVRDGAIGKVAFARVRSSHGGPAAGAWPNDPTWFYQKGSGPLFDMGVYGIDEITGILGPARRVVAFAGITEPTRTVRAGPFQGKTIPVTADDNVLMMLDFGGSTFAVVDGTFNVNASRGPKVEIYGREGTVNLSGAPYGNDGPDLEVFQVGAGWRTPRTAEDDRRMRRLTSLHRAALVDHFADRVGGRAPDLLGLDHARHVLEIVLKAAESARTGVAVPLDTTFTAFTAEDQP